MRIIKLDDMTTTTSTTSTTSTINFNIENLAGSTMLRKYLLGYFLEGKTATFNVYYSINGCEIPFLIEIREDYISVTELLLGDRNLMKININNQNKINYEEEDQLAGEYNHLIGLFIEQYLNHLAGVGLFDC